MAVLNIVIAPFAKSLSILISWSGLGAALAILVPLYVVYQTTLHPLAKYPGPFTGKLTRFYSLYHAFKGDKHWDLYTLHQKYGPIVRYGPDHISVNDASAVEQIYGHKINVQKSSWYSAFYGISIFNAVDKDVHARKRRVMTQAFSDQAVRTMEPYVISAVKDWCAGIGGGADPATAPKSGQWTGPMDMVHWSAAVIFDVLGEICFGKSFETSLKPDNRFWFGLMTLNVRIINICGQMPFLTNLGLSAYLRRGTAANRAKQVDFTRKSLGARLKAAGEGSKRKDIIYYLQLAKDPETGEGYTQAELLHETVLLLGAGADTANSGLTSMFYFLVHHPDVLARLTKDIRSAFTDVDSIVTGPKLQKVTYLRACLDEAMRLCPPIPMLLPREVLPGGVRVNGHFFPEGTIIGVPTYALHHDQKHFDKPFDFDPSRWVRKGSPEAVGDEGVDEHVMARQREAFIPWSVGPRACLGRNMATMELELSIARAVFLYDMKLAPGTENLGVGPHGEYKIKDNFIVGKEGPVLQFRRHV